LKQHAKIEAGVRTCLAACRLSAEPYSRLSAFIENLRYDTSWTDQELVELEMLIGKVLLCREKNGIGGTGRAVESERDTTAFVNSQPGSIQGDRSGR
jgi:hypothetical protein